MKQLFLVAATVLALSACSGSDNTPKPNTTNNVSEDMDVTHKLAYETLHRAVSEPTRFKVLEYGKMDSCFTVILDFHTPYDQVADSYRENAEQDMKTNPEKAKAELDSMKVYQKKDAEERASFKSQFFGWKMSVRFETDTIYTGDVYFNIDQNFATLNRYALLQQEGITK